MEQPMRIFKVPDMGSTRLDVLMTYKELCQVRDYMAILGMTILDNKELPIRIFMEVPGHENENY